jgi:hypothetical protein
LQAFAQTLRTKTVPFLADLFRSDWGRVRAVVGQSLFEAAEPPEDVPDEYGDAAEQSGLWNPAPWWNPRGPWDAARFLAALSKHGAPAQQVILGAEKTETSPAVPAEV